MTADMADLVEDAPPPDAGRSASGARLMAELRQANARADRAERELQRTRQGAAYVVGSLLVRAAKDPRRLVLLPRDLWRVWRLRKGRRAAVTSGVPKARPREVLDLDATRLLLPRLAAVPTGRRLSIAGIVSRATAREWSAYAAVSPALPQDAAALVEALDPDIVIIDTSAALPGEAWAHLGNPAAVDRMIAASELVDAAQALGRPVVMLRMTPPSHTAFLDDLAERCDLVVDGPGASRRSAWHPGIDVLAWASSPPAVAGLLVPPEEAGWSPASRRLQALLREASSRPISPDPAADDESAWARALAETSAGIGSPSIVPSRLLGAGRVTVGLLASGRRVLSGGDDDLQTLLARRPAAASAAVISPDAAALLDLARRGATPLTPDEHRAAMAAVLIAASAPVQLTRLAERLSIPSRPRACWDVALAADDGLDPDRVLRQSWRPREVLITEDLPSRARDALAEEGIAVIRIGPGDLHDPTRLAIASPYLARQVDLANPHDVVDLLAQSLLGQAPRPHPTDARIEVIG